METLSLTRFLLFLMATVVKEPKSFIAYNQKVNFSGLQFLKLLVTYMTFKVVTLSQAYKYLCLVSGVGGYIKMTAPSFHGGMLRYGCPKCTKHFSRRDNLQTHIANIHGDARGPFTCPRCGKLTKNKMSLRSHMYEYHKGWATEKRQ